MPLYNRNNENARNRADSEHNTFNPLCPLGWQG